MINVYDILTGVSIIIEQCQRAVQAKGQEENHILFLLNGPVKLVCFPYKAEKQSILLMDQGEFESACEIQLYAKVFYLMLVNNLDSVVWRLDSSSELLWWFPRNPLQVMDDAIPNGQ